MKKIIVLGDTGTGKSTLINVLLNLKNCVVEKGGNDDDELTLKSNN